MASDVTSRGIVHRKAENHAKAADETKTAERFFAAWWARSVERDVKDKTSSLRLRMTVGCGGGVWKASRVRAAVGTLNRDGRLLFWLDCGATGVALRGEVRKVTGRHDCASFMLAGLG